MSEQPEPTLRALDSSGFNHYYDLELGACEGFLNEPVLCGNCNELHSHVKFIMLKLIGHEGEHVALIPERSTLGQAILSGELTQYARVSLDKL